MGLDVAAVDLGGFGDPAFLGQSRQDARPDAATAPSVPAIVDRRRRPVFAWAVLPTAAAFEHVDDTRNHPPVIDTPRPRLFFGKCGSIAAHAASDNQNNVRDILWPPVLGGSLNQWVNHLSRG